MKFIAWVKTSFFEDQSCWILWLPVIFGCGIVFYFFHPNSPYTLPLCLFFSSLLLIFIFREQTDKIFIIAFAMFLAGFLWTKLYVEKIADIPTIKHKFYATAIGRIDEINSFYNPILKRNSYQIVLRDLQIYKAGSIEGDVVIKKVKPQKLKKYHKKKHKIKTKNAKNAKNAENAKNAKNAKNDVSTQENQVDNQIAINQEASLEHKKRKKRRKKVDDEVVINNQVAAEIGTLEQANQTTFEEEKPKKKKRRRKKNSEEAINQAEQGLEASSLESTTPKIKKKHKKPKPKKSKRDNKTVIKSYLNVEGYQEIDREFLAIDYKSQNKNWVGNRYIKAPSKVILSVNTKFNDAKIGDVIQTRVVLEPFKPPYFPGGYDKGFANYFKGIGGGGYAASELKILKTNSTNSFLQDIKILRQNIARKILDQTDEQGGTIAVALLVGAQNLIKPDVMQAMRNSGLAHIISISGLHFTLAAGIFFFVIRFLLSLNQYLTLHYNIKKIAAVIAIFTGFFYLLLADMPVPAVRSFIVIALMFIAILIDSKPDSFRSTAFAALAILFFSPSSIFSVSFQLSFAAILALITLADSTKQYHINSSDRPVYLKFFLYFLGIVLSSLAATIATTPFSIYHFNNFIAFGFLANLLAIPITSFITMPFGFLALFLMPFGIEKIALYPMQISIGWIVDIANFTANLPHSYLTIKAISPLSFALIILGGLWFCLWKKSWRLLGFAPIILGVYLAYQTPIPTLLIDQDRKMFAFYEDGRLIFLKPTKSKQAMVWTKKLGLNEITTIEDLSEEEKQKLQINCQQNFCELRLKEKWILVLKGRNEIDEICQKNDEKHYDIVANFSKKYQLPKCVLGVETLKIGRTQNLTFNLLVL